MRILFVIFASLVMVLIQAQPSYKIKGQLKGDYKKMTAQGMAIWKNRAYLLNRPGVCRVYDLKNKVVVDSFSLASRNNSPSDFCKLHGVFKNPVIDRDWPDPSIIKSGGIIIRWQHGVIQYTSHTYAVI